MQTKRVHKATRPLQANTQTQTLICTHLTLIETTGWQSSPLTGSIRGQSAAEPHAVLTQRDTLDYKGGSQAHNRGGVGGGGGGVGRQERDDGISRREDGDWGERE